ncbi:MAG: extracellular solute-binding protein [Gorillibacterium sp.]|nr:extracellular solute-binding protein [Gorillibacterium sp.]
MEPLIEDYQTVHPELAIHIQTSTFTQLPAKLQTALAAGYAAPDLAMVEISYLERFKQFPDYFYNLQDYGADELSARFLDWKWEQVLNKDRDFIYGLPTDIGPYAMLYRSDLFALSGLPTKPEAVAESINTWDKFLVAGAQVRAKTGKAFINDLENLYRAILGQSNLRYYDPISDELIMDTNPEVRQAWNYALEAHKLNLSADIAIDTQRWGKGLLTGDFAVMLCPAWMIGSIKTSAPTASGLWNITEMPGNSANRGGSFLTLPKTGEYPKEAYALAKWLTSPEQQLAAFMNEGTFPSTPEVYDSPAIRDFHDPYFGNAPIGQTYSESAKKVIPSYYGPHHADVETDILEHLTLVDQGKLDPDESWDIIVKRAKEIDASFRE